MLWTLHHIPEDLNLQHGHCMKNFNMVMINNGLLWFDMLDIHTMSQVIKSVVFKASTSLTKNFLSLSAPANNHKYFIFTDFHTLTWNSPFMKTVSGATILRTVLFTLLYNTFILLLINIHNTNKRSPQFVMTQKP